MQRQRTGERSRRLRQKVGTGRERPQSHRIVDESPPRSSVALPCSSPAAEAVRVLPAMPQAQFASLLGISHLIWPQMNPSLLLLLCPTSGDSDISVSPRMGTPNTTNPGEGTRPDRAQGAALARPSLGMHPASSAASLEMHPSLGQSWAAPERFCSAPGKKFPPGAGCVLEARPDQAKSRAERGRAGGGDSARRGGRSPAGASRRGH